MRKLLFILVAALSAVMANAQLNDADVQKAIQLVSSNKAGIGLAADELTNVKVSNTYLDKSTGMTMVYLQQTFKDIPVYNQLLVITFKNNQVVSHSGVFNHGMEQLANIKTGIPPVTAESAVQSALSDRKLTATANPVALSRKDNDRKIEFSNLGVSRENITASLMWVPIEEQVKKENAVSTITKMHLAWQVYIIPTTGSDYWLVSIDASDSKTLRVDNLTVFDNWGHTPETSPAENPAIENGKPKVNNEENNLINTDKEINRLSADIDNTFLFLVNTATYRVVPFPAESPQVTGGTPALRSNPWTAATGNATSLNWHTGLSGTDYAYTRGNNVWAYQDRTAPTNTGTVDKSASSTTTLPGGLTFDFTPDFGQEPTQTSNQKFNITNLFYWNNVIHDVMYQYGFDEPAANFQDDNQGRGGAGNDHVNAEAQDVSGTNNANFATPADGGSGRMQMYLWNAPTPDRDGDADNSVIVHEYGHGISNRLTGGGVSTCLQNAEQMGEGWSDYYALMFTQDWATATLNTGFNTPRGIGLYALNNANIFPTSPPNTGIRHLPYCTNFAVNNQVYLATLPTSPHDRGEIWCAALWDMTWNIIIQEGSINPNLYDAAGTGGNIIAMKLVTQGLKLQQCSPGFISGRDGILAADVALYGGAHRCAIMNAFARRGMGLFASEGSTNNLNDQVPDFSGYQPEVLLTQNGTVAVFEGQNIVYNNKVTNSDCQTISNYVLRDTLPLNVTFVSATNGGTYNAGNRVVSWTINLAQSAVANYGFTVTVNPGSFFPPAPPSIASVKMRSRIFNTADQPVSLSDTITLIQSAAPFIEAAPPVVITAENATPVNNAPDPGETLTVNLPLKNSGAVNTTNLVATLLATGGVNLPSGPQTYGVVTSLGAPVGMPFTFKALGNCGDNITLTLALQDGATNLGTVTFTLRLGAEAGSTTTTFANTTPIVIPSVGTANPYASNISVSGLTGTITKVTVGLKQINHTYYGDLDLLLVSPTGQKMIIMSDAGRAFVTSTNVNILLDDAASSLLPETTGIPSGTYKPTNYTFGAADAFAAPAPVGPYLNPGTAGTATFASAFNGLNANGTWSLYVVDDEAGDLGNFNGGWEINISTTSTVCAVVTSAPTELFVNDALTADDHYTTAAGNDATGDGSSTAPFATIGHAVLVAQPGNTIYVDAGTFPEEVNVNKSILIKGSNAGTAGNGVRIAESIVDGQNAAHSCFLVNADNVTIDGFKITGGGGVYNSGVWSSLTQHGMQLLGNIITDNVIGAYPQSEGASSIKNNLFDGNNRAGAAGGAGIYTESSNALTIEGNEFKNHLTNSAVIFAATAASAHQNVVFTLNNIHNNNGDNSMVYCIGINGGDFNKNTITQPGTTALKFAGACTGVIVKNNFLDNNGTGVKTADDGYGLGGNSAIQVHENSFASNSLFAIQNFESTHTIDAACNWYGSTDPAAKIYGQVAYTPFLTTGTDNAPASAGFQPVPGSCTGTTICESAATQAYVSNIATGNQAHRGELGMQFIVNAPGGILIKQLGAFDDGGNGITGLQPGGSVRVAIFNRTTHAIVPGLDVNISGSGDAYTGLHRMVNITPAVNLPAGDYVIVAKGYNAGERNGNSFNGGALFPAGNDGGGAISFGNETSWGPDDPAGFNYPTSSGNFGDAHVFLAGTFNFTTTIPCTTTGSDCESPAAEAYTSTTTTGNQAHRGELGLEFTVNNASGIIVKQLGAFDDGGNGINGLQPGGGVRVAIFNKATQTIVPGLDVTIVGAGDGYAGNHRMKNVTPVTLLPGTYVLVAKGYNAGERNGNSFNGGGPYPAGNTGGGAISFSNEASYGPDDPNGFNYPASAVNVGDAHLFLAGTFNFTTPIPCGGVCESNPFQAHSSATNAGNQAYRGELGLAFSVTNVNGISVKQLGAFDDGGNGITGLQPGGGVRVAIFNRTTGTIIPGLDATVIGNADHYTGNHRMVDITPVLLPPGSYVVVAKGYNAAERNGNSYSGGGPFTPGDNGGGAISFGSEALYGADDPNGFNFPANSVNTGDAHLFLAGTFNFTVNIDCPPPVVTNSISQPVKETKPVLVLKTGEVKIYPNPTNGQFTVQLQSAFSGKVNIQVMNSYGRMVEQKTIGAAAKGATTLVPFNLSNQPAGIYLVKVESAEGIQTGKIVIGR